MGTRFIIGRAGSGKTHFLHEELVRHIQKDPLNEIALVLVPKHATFQTERAIATDPRLGGFINVRVLSPDDLGELALVETGAASGARLDPIGRGLILGHLLRTYAADLPYFRNSAHQPGLAAEIDRTFGEFERAGRDLGDIDELIDQVGKSSHSDQQAVARKLIDLRRIYQLYQKFLAAQGFDPYSRQTRAHEAIERCPLVQRSLVLIDDFYDLTAHERLLIASVAKTARQTFISLLLDPDAPVLSNLEWIPTDLGVFHRTGMTYRRLHQSLTQAGVMLDPPLRLRDAPRFQTGNLRAIEEGFESPQPMESSDGSVVLQLATDRADEVAAAARAIKSLMAKGFRQRDICVLARVIGDYEALIDVTFVEHDIAYFVDRRRSAEHHPLIRTLHAIGRIVQTRWAPVAVIELARAGLIGISSDEADLLADYIRQHNLPREAWLEDKPWEYHRRVEEEESHGRSHFSDADVATVNALRVRLRTALAEITDPAWTTGWRSVGKCVETLFAVLSALNVSQSMAAIIKTAEEDNRLQDRAEHELGWTRLIELVDQPVDLLGDVHLPGNQFISLLQTALDELELAITPPTIDQVLVGSVDRTRTQNPRAVILLGMNAGEFPLLITEKAVLNDRDRRALLEAGVEVEPPSRQMILFEQLLGYVALTSASQKLILIRTARDDDGNELEPSPFWHTVGRCIGGLVEQNPANPIARIATPRQVVSHALAWGRGDNIATSDSAGAEIYNWLAGSAPAAIKSVRDRAWPVLSYTNQPKLSKKIALQIFASPLHASVSRIEAYAACPFQHFLRYGLRLQEPPDSDVSALDLGILYHGVLERLVRKTIDQRTDFATATDLTQPQIREIAQQVGQELRNQVFLSNARNRYTLEHLETVVERLIRSQQFIAERGVFRPGFAELVFGRNGQLPPLEMRTPHGNDVVLSGKIDRVDITASNTHFTVIDYKLGGQTFDLGDVAHGLMLQLLTYLLVLEAHGEKLTGTKLTPGAALYVKMLRSIDPTKNPIDAPEPHEPEYHARSMPRGVINAAAAGHMDSSLGSVGKSDTYKIARTKSGELARTGNDAIEQDQFADLIRFVGRKIAMLADAMIAGDISIAPYVIGKVTPCPHCGYRSVCRFDRLIGGYRRLEPLTRDQAMEVIRTDGAES
ncbi:MAG: PD-(D/E)XK nuclease family protein [Burkholderiales bacterium]|nr:PD-(D/E)XK nuclease family protein [Phycisphaerae bacterium]